VNAPANAITVDITLRVAASLECTQGADGELAIRVVGDLCVEDEQADLLTGAHFYVQRLFRAALRDLVTNYEHRTRTYSRAIEANHARDAT
jgi:hypothetical protein